MPHFGKNSRWWNNRFTLHTRKSKIGFFRKRQDKTMVYISYTKEPIGSKKSVKSTYDWGILYWVIT
jgi:hypothetical protein